MTERQEAALEYAKKHSQAPDKETPDWIINDFLAGYDTAMEHVDREHREFYLLVRTFIEAIDRPEGIDLRADQSIAMGAVLKEIKKHLDAFTEREQQQLPL